MANDRSSGLELACFSKPNLMQLLSDQQVMSPTLPYVSVGIVSGEMKSLVVGSYHVSQQATFTYFGQLTGF